MPNKNEKKPVKKMNITIGKKGRFDPKKFINTEPTLKEAKRTSIVISFGRMNPVTSGHEKLVNKVISEALKRKADSAIYLSHTKDKKKNPLSYDDKINFASKAFGKVIRRSPSKTIIQVAKELSDQYDTLVLVVGSDRVQEFETLLNKYNGKEYNFDNIEVISAGDRDPDAEDISGMSASKLRNLAAEGKFEEFVSGLPKKLKSSAKEVYNAVRKGLGMNEEFVTEEALDEAPLSIQQRKRRGMQMRRLKSRLKIARKKAKRKMASKEKLQVRARRKARDIIRNRLSKKPYSDMSPPEKIALDKRLARISPAAIERIAKKQLPGVRTAEKERLRNVLNPTSKNEEFEMFFEDYYSGLSKSTSSKRKAHFEKGARMDDDNPAAYKPAPGDARAKTKPSIHTKRFNQMFGEKLEEACERDTQPRKRYHMALEKNGAVKFDKRFKFFKKNLEESSEDLLAEMIDLQESVENFLELEESSKEALKNKAEKTGISYGVLKKVYDRGVAAWRTGHRPGTTPAQWGMARVNSFATKGKGTWGKADKDLAAKVRSEEVELDSFFDLSEMFELIEASILDKALAAIHKHVMGGSDVMDIVWQVSRAKGVDIPGKQLYNNYIEKYGEPNSNKLNTISISRLKRKYGFNEGENLARVKLQIAREKHERMKAAAAERDKNMKESVDKSDPANREHGTDSLVKILKGDTPGQQVKEAALNDYIEKGARVRFEYETMTDGPENVDATVVGTDADTGRLRVRDNSGKLYVVKHEDVDLIEEYVYINEADETCPILTVANLNAFEKFVDKMFEKYNIDFEFTKHFRERMSDKRNDPCISMKELAQMIQKIYKKYQNGEKSLSKFVNAEAVIKDMQTDLNMPIAVEYDRKNDDLVVITKTIMRKKNFRTPSPEIKL